MHQAGRITQVDNRSVLINHPHVGSLWLDNARIVGDQVVGETWDEGDVGSGLLPDDYQGEPVTMHFPLTCVRKWRESK